MAECQLPKLNVGGSTPLSRSNLKHSETHFKPVNKGLNAFRVFGVNFRLVLKQAEFWRSNAPTSHTHTIEITVQKESNVATCPSGRHPV